MLLKRDEKSSLFRLYFIRPAVSAGCLPEAFLKTSGKIELITKAQLGTDFVDGQLLLKKELFGFDEHHVVNVFAERKAGLFPEQIAQLALGKKERIGELCNTEADACISLNVADNLVNLFGILLYRYGREAIGMCKVCNHLQQQHFKLDDFIIILCVKTGCEKRQIFLRVWEFADPVDAGQQIILFHGGDGNVKK